MDDRPDDPTAWVSFDVLAEGPDAWQREDEWNRGCVYVGRVRRADGGSVVVAAWLMAGKDGSLSFDAGSEAAAAHARDAIGRGGIRALIHGSNPDGSLWFLELVPELASAAAASLRVPSLLP